MIFIFYLTGSYTLDSNCYEIPTMLIFGGVGYIMRKVDFAETPLVEEAPGESLQT